MYKITKSNGTVLTVDYPNWVKYDARCSTFICCGENDAECILLQEGEGEKATSTYYNINVQKYPQYEVVKVEKI